jgi:murein DD-endopeptidase MepM/ murein hydrolase activator NlpD
MPMHDAASKTSLTQLPARGWRGHKPLKPGHCMARTEEPMPSQSTTVASYEKQFAHSQRRLLPMAAIALALLSAAAASAYELPIRANDLKSGERYHTFVHTGGIQAEGKDIGARRFKSETSWSSLKTDGADKNDLNNWIVYGKTVYAMAPGVIIRCWRNAPNNPVGGYHAEYEKGFIGGGGNSVWIRHDDGVETLYAHMRPGSVPADLCPNNATLFSNKGGSGETAVTNGKRVNAGQKIGEVGNSGASGSGPHLHVHMQKSGSAHVMRFARGLTSDLSDGKATLNGPWVPVNDGLLPNKSILVWPPSIVGNYRWDGTNDEDYQRLVDHMADSGMMPDIISCQNNGQDYNSRWVPAQGKWASFHGMTSAVAAEKHAFYTGQGYRRTSSYTCGSRQVAVWRKP